MTGACKTPASIVKPVILYPSRGGELARIGPEEVRERYGVDPNQVSDFIALRREPENSQPLPDPILGPASRLLDVKASRDFDPLGVYPA